MPHVTLGGGTAYHEIVGEGQPLVLLHGGFCSLETMRPIGDALSAGFRVHAAERAGHGRTADREGPFGYDRMAADTLAYLDATGIDAAHVVGFSDGAIVGLLLARDHPARVRSLVAISANLDPGGFVPDDYPHVTVPDETTAQLRREYEELSPDGPEHAEVVLGKLLELWQREPDIPAASLAAVAAPTLVMAGEHDAVARDHTTSIAAAIPGAALEIVPGTTHLLVVERPAEVAERIRAFLARTRAGAAPEDVAG